MKTPIRLTGNQFHLASSRGFVAQLSRPEQSRLVLSATGFVVSTVLMIWLLSLALLARPRPEPLGIWVAPPDAVAPFIRHQGEDLRRITGRTDSVDGTALEASIGNALERAGGGDRPLVLYLSAAGVADRNGNYFLRPGAVRPGASVLFAESLIERLTEVAARRKLLLILDAGQVGSDRNLHVFGNGFLAAFKARLRIAQSKGLAVLCSSAPGQTSWESDLDRSSVFAYFVAQGLDEKARRWDSTSPHVTVRALANYVRFHVDRWVRANRKGVQTPEILGDISVNFVLPRIAPPRTANNGPTAESDAARLARLDDEWVQHHRLRQSRPYRHAPLLWRQFQHSLLRAERAIRAGATSEADSLLARFPAQRKELAERAAGLRINAPWSLAMHEKLRAASPADPMQSTGVNKTVALEKGLEDLITAPKDATNSPVPVGPAPAVVDGPPAAGARKAEIKADVPGPGATRRRVTELPDVIEAQLLRWARSFTEAVGNAGAFHGPPGERLKEAQKVRELAEQAASADDRVSHWVAPFVDAGDKLRRRAQDALFVDDRSALETASSLLEQARTQYREALSVADRLANALDLVEEIESELSEYGEWQVCRGEGDIAGELGNDLVAVLTTTAALAAAIQTSSDDATGGGPALGRHVDRVKAIDELVRKARIAFGHLRRTFEAECARLAASAGPSNWREIDAILRVPAILPEQRRVLLDRIRSTEVAASLEQGESSLEDLSPRGIGAADSTSAPPDHDFWRQALGLARLEIGLLEIGGAPEASLDNLRKCFGNARAVINNGSSEAFDCLAQLSEGIRAVRNEVVESAKLRPDQWSDFAALIAADRAQRVALPADVLDRADLTGNEIERRRRHEQLLWNGRRLLADFDPGRARQLFKAAELLGDTKALNEALRVCTEMDQAQVVMTADADDPFTVSPQSERPLGVRVSTVGPVPPGQAAILVKYDSFQPLSVAEKASMRDARQGVLVDFEGMTTQGSEALTFLVARTEPGPSPVDTEVIPRAFYRGHLGKVDRGVTIRLLPAKDPVSITIAQSYEKLRFKDFTDQFKEHPGQGYLHCGSNLQYKLTLNTESKMRAVVRYGLKEHPKSFKEVIVELDPKKPKEIHDTVRGDDFQNDRTGGKLFIPPLNLEVTVSEDRANRPRLGHARFPFRMIPPEEYIQPECEWDPIQRVLNILVVHLARDKATGPVEVLASIGGRPLQAWVRRSSGYIFQFPIPPGEKKVRWRVGIERIPQAFSGDVETPPAAAENAAAN
jgi:hypothetical protein